MKFKSKPVEIEAMPWERLDFDDDDRGLVEVASTIIDWILGHGGTARYHEASYIMEFGLMRLEREPFISIDTHEGTMAASPGDWIIQGTEGEFYPCKPSVFERKYEPSP